jgi:hypothetical protein
MSNFCRHKKEKNFTIIDNCVFTDHSLSLKAKGLLTQIYSLPDDWNYSITGLATLFSDGKNAVNAALQELIDHGYIIRTQKFDEYGRFSGYEYDIYETPQNIASEPFTENPSTDNPSTEKPFTENQTQLNTNIENTNIENTKEENPLISPEEELDFMFKMFWKAYPKKVDPKGCQKKFIKIKDLKKIFPDIMQALETQKRSRQWTEENGKYIPHPSTWINQERWNIVNEADEKQAKIDEIAAENIDFFLN